MRKVFGINLGTTFSSIAIVNEQGRAEIIPNLEGEWRTPSVVMFDGEMPIVGSIAKKSAVQSPLNVVQFVKRQMGNPAWKFLSEGGEQYSPEEISAIILKRLKEDAESMLGEEVRDAVITVPAYFDDAQRNATQDAGRIAGLNVLHIIDEPAAAALAYGIEKSLQDQTILVYDLGGVTFDVTIMRISKETIEVLATVGDRNLGGFDWDNEVMKFLNAEFQKQEGIDLLDDPGTEQDLRDKAEIAKKTLSRNDKTNVYLSADGKSLSIPLTLEQFNSLTEPLFRRTLSFIEMVLEDANLTSWSQVDKTLLVGGSTRMQAIPAFVEKVTGKKPWLGLPSDECIAMGAALQGAILMMQQDKAEPSTARDIPEIEFTDVSLGRKAMENYYRTLNIAPAATEEEIKKAILRDRRIWSNRTNAPDFERKQEAERMVTLLANAEQILLDPTRKQQYDQVLRATHVEQTQADQTKTSELQGKVEPGTVRDILMINICSHSMGIVMTNEFNRRHKINRIILKKDTPIPCKVSMQFQTLDYNQAILLIQVTEGETANLDYVSVVGEGVMSLPPYPKGAPFELIFAYDMDGIVHVTVFDKTTNKLLGEVELKRKSKLKEIEL